MNIIKKHISVMLFVSIIILTFVDFSAKAEGKDTPYENVTFSGDEAETKEFEHLLLAWLVYEDVSEYVGRSVADYVDAHDELYDKEIWTDSGITYKAVYNSIIGDYMIYSVCDENNDSGMYAVTFTRDTEAIIAFRGSDSVFENSMLDESNDWIHTDFRFALLNSLSRQFDDATTYIKTVKKDLMFSGVQYNLDYTGHSLGGALVAYASITTGNYGYSFDGACGHVIDLIFYENYLDIYNLDGSEAMNFCNYTDDTGYPAADLIQHTNAGAYYQIDRKTDVSNLTENTLVPKVTTAASHLIWSTVRYDGNTLCFSEKVNPDEDGYTYAPKGEVKIDTMQGVDEVPGTVLDIIIQSGGLNFSEIIGTLTSTVKSRRVVISGVEGGTVMAENFASFFGGYKSGTLMYGSVSDDKLKGTEHNDVFVAGKGNDHLIGGDGDDKYVVDINPSGTLIIEDTSGYSRIMLRDMNFDGVDNVNIVDNTIILPDNQKIKLDIDEMDKVIIYTYNNGRIKKLGGITND